VPDELRAMLRSDPLHRIQDGVRYPAVLLRSGENDSRVPPWQAAKLAARLSAASTSGRPILLQVPKQQGHLSVPRAQEIDNTADDYAFALWQSGLLPGP
jgi:prolyl oligopeptidase